MFQSERKNEMMQNVIKTHQAIDEHSNHEQIASDDRIDSRDFHRICRRI